MSTKTPEYEKLIKEGKFNKVKLSPTTLKKIVNNKKIQNNYKNYFVNKAFQELGGQKVYNTLGNSIQPSNLLPGYDNSKLSPSQFIKKYSQYIDHLLMQGTRGCVVLGKQMRKLGKGVKGTVFQGVSNIKCKPQYRGAVLKVSKYDAEFENEVKTMVELNQISPPIAPRILTRFVFRGYGFILIQNAQTMFPDARKIVEWRRIKKPEQKAILPELKKTMDKLHKIGFGHGNMHNDNVWVAVFDVEKTSRNPTGKKYKVFFTDFGRAYNIRKRYNLLNRKWIYPGMAHRIYTRTSNNRLNNNLPPIMDDNEVFDMYKEYYDTMYQRFGGSLPNEMRTLVPPLKEKFVTL